VKRLVAWIGATAGGIAAYRLLKRRPEAAPEPAPAEPDDRAEELRTKLAESRVAEPAVEEAPAEPEAAEPEPEPESPESRRQRVHEEGRGTLDDMKSE
jgi:hypothetical protein